MPGHTLPGATKPYWGAIMDITTALQAFESIEKSSEVGVGRNTRKLPRRGQVEPADDLAALLRALSDASIRELDQLINQLQKLRTQLQNAANRIQGDIAGYAELSQQTMQLTSIIVDSVRKLPPGAPQ
jgi:DNA anti-recombination protein RmuC